MPKHVPILALVLSVACIVGGSQHLGFAASPTPSSSVASPIPALPVAGVDVTNMPIVDVLRQLFAGTGLNIYGGPDADPVHVTYSTGPDTLDRVAAAIAKKAGLVLVSAPKGLRIVAAPTGFDPITCARFFRTNEAAHTTQLYGVPLGPAGLPIPGSDCVPFGEPLAHHIRETFHSEDPARLASIIDEVTEVTSEGRTIQIGEKRRVVRPWTLVKRSIQPSEADSYYNGCLKIVPIAMMETWRQGDGKEITLPGSLVAAGEPVRDCPRAAMQAETTENRTRIQRTLICDPRTSSAVYHEQQIIETRSIEIMADGQRRPGRWQQTASVTTDPPQASPELAPTICSTQAALNSAHPGS